MRTKRRDSVGGHIQESEVGQAGQRAQTRNVVACQVQPLKTGTFAQAAQVADACGHKKQLVNTKTNA